MLKEKIKSRAVTDDERERIDNNFTHHAPAEKQIEKYSFLRSMFKHMAMMLCRLCPQSRELSVALTKLEEVMFWANAAIARNEKPSDD